VTLYALIIASGVVLNLEAMARFNRFMETDDLVHAVKAFLYCGLAGCLFFSAASLPPQP
jgi:hypothetical protein